MDGWLNVNHQSLESKERQLDRLRQQVAAMEDSTQRQREVIQALQETSRTFNMRLDTSSLQREYGLHLEAGALPRQNDEEEEHEDEDEEEDNDSSTRQQQQGIEAPQHPAAVQYWEKMSTHETLRIILSFFSLQSFHDLGLTCRPLNCLLLNRPRAQGTGTANNDIVTSFIGTHLHSERFLKHFIDPAAATANVRLRILSLSLSSNHSASEFQTHLSLAFTQDLFQQLQVLEVTAKQDLNDAVFLSYLFTQIARHLALGRAPHLRTLSLTAPLGIQDEDVANNYVDVSNRGSFFHHLQQACIRGRIASFETLSLRLGGVSGSALDDAPPFYYSLRHLSHLRDLSLSCHGSSSIPGATHSALAQGLFVSLSLLENLTLRGGTKAMELGPVEYFVKEDYLQSFAQSIHEQRQQLQDNYNPDLDDGEFVPLARIKKLHLVAFPVHKEETLTMLLAALMPLSIPSASISTSHSPSFVSSSLAELDLTHMQLTSSAIQDRTFRAYASPVVRLLQMLAIPVTTPCFHTLRLGLLHTPFRSGQEDSTALKALCSALRKRGPRLHSLDLSLPLMTKAAFTLLTTPSGGTMLHHFQPLRQTNNAASASSAGKPSLKKDGGKEAGLSDDDCKESEGDEKKERNDKKGEEKLEPILQPPDYPLLQRLRLVIPERFEPEALAFQKLVARNCPSLEHVDLHISLASRLLTQGLLRVLLQLQHVRTLRLRGHDLNNNILKGVKVNRTSEETQEEKAVASPFTEALAGGEWAARLCVLSLRRCDLDDRYLEKVLVPRSLAGCPHLSTLDLTENPAFSQEGYAKLVQALCVVKLAGLCPFLQRVELGPATHDDQETHVYDVSLELLKPAIHKALHPFG